jgi:hypothetical protein
MCKGKSKFGGTLTKEDIPSKEPGKNGATSFVGRSSACEDIEFAIEECQG